MPKQIQLRQSHLALPQYATDGELVASEDRVYLGTSETVLPILSRCGLARIASEPIEIGNLVSFSRQRGECRVSLASRLQAKYCWGYALTAAAAGNPALIATLCGSQIPIAPVAGLSIDGTYYLDEAGLASPIAPTTGLIQIIGFRIGDSFTFSPR